MNCRALILAAGASTRLGSPKQLLKLNGETLLERAVRIAKGAALLPVIVLGAFEKEIRAGCNLAGVTVLTNTLWREGIGTSLAFGVQALKGAQGVVVMTCDMPAVTSEHLRRLPATGAIMASRYAGKKGVPAYFPQSSFADLSRLCGDTGARELIQQASAIDLSNGDLDIDTPESWASAQKRFTDADALQRTF